MSNSRLLDLTKYKGVLPYSSELFGVYQPMIGWRSKRTFRWLDRKIERPPLLESLADCFASPAQIEINSDNCDMSAANMQTAAFAVTSLREQDSVLYKRLAQYLVKLGYANGPPPKDIWQQVAGIIERSLGSAVLEEYSQRFAIDCREMSADKKRRMDVHELYAYNQRTLAVEEGLKRETKLAGVFKELLNYERYDLLEQIFYRPVQKDGLTRFKGLLEKSEHKDPLDSFDPTGDLRDVTVSPIGITHIFRQFFFELDTFLGPPVAHLYVPPYTTSEIIEVSTRRVYIEKVIEQSLETIKKEESETTEEDEISEAVKQDNRKDMKLGITSTVEQSWGTGNITATGSFNLDTSQGEARETSHKRMRRQTAKLSSEIRENFKTTFKTVTETTDSVSKRYMIANPGGDMLNYEMRRKMRQVAVQVQDVGTYLCWDTYVDEPGADLGIANLVHMSRPADLIPRPSDLTFAELEPVDVAFTANAVWNYDDRKGHQGDQFVLIGVAPIPPGPEGYVLVRPSNNEKFPLFQISASGKNFHQVWAYFGRFRDGNIQLGVWTKPAGIGWDERVDFVLQGSVRYVPGPGKKAEIEARIAARSAEQRLIDEENARKTKAAFFTGARERIEQSRAITARKYDDLREEERIIVYRRLISSLMTDDHYDAPAAGESDRNRHVLSQLLNTIFDIDKMLYFVAPEWWKPRAGSRVGMGYNELAQNVPEALVTWDDGLQRPDNYLITNKSMPAAKGSSLGWLLQLDGDDMRNSFLNAPWVKAVIPVRPGREKAAINWLKAVGVEGSDGLDHEYGGSPEEKAEIREGLGLATGQKVTIELALEYLCQKVAQKHAESNVVKPFGDGDFETDDSSTVLATPVEKVYEYGFYPLQGGFRADPVMPSDDTNNQGRNFQVYDQWIEILPTDQVVPVEVRYNPITGRQIPPDDVE
ncbi:peptidoglycan-binding protein [Aureimonas fodinaquatilis]|uniref:Peptidoglycan-binding protein n=1 Tax=Aureimonas fodinaquatilis TaxID=2565783 RepID=A0A5B0E2J2_9HYPH|nr:peptidoglycan-binding protein [Aureimonas fodinaquatilis]KAA0972171.1 peptidoglycan-binding protein [Aureimonas fodinaquatilis]